MLSILAGHGLVARLIAGRRNGVRYIIPGSLLGHKKCVGKLGSNVIVGLDWSDDPRKIFSALNAAR